MPNLPLIIIAVMNVITMLFYIIDKYFAVKNKWRISEKTLILLAFFMGAGGALLGMVLSRHKIRKAKFLIFVPLFLVLQIIITVVLFLPENYFSVLF